MQEKLEMLNSISLNLQPERIGNRPLCIWYGSDDPVVPIRLTVEFLEEIRGEAYGQNIAVEFSEGFAHSVPSEFIQQMAEYFQQTL